METGDLIVSADHIQIVKSEYEACTSAFTPISRNSLARHLSVKTGVPYKTALQVVDVYCDQNNVPVPDYLGREFNVGWLKVVSLALVAGTVGLCIYGRSLHLQKQNPWFMWVCAVLCGGLAVLVWIKSLQAEVSNSAEEKRQLG